MWNLLWLVLQFLYCIYAIKTDIEKVSRGERVKTNLCFIILFTLIACITLAELKMFDWRTI